jgi:ADP-ribose pyrophosphatase
VAATHPRILARRLSFETQYVRVVEKDVECAEGAEPETFWAVASGRYAAVLALTEDGRIPLVRQFRPAVERFVLELPSGAVDAGEEPEAAARRELLEEAGCAAAALVPVGPLIVDSGRQETLQWAYFAPAVRVVEETPEPVEPLETLFVQPAELARLIVAGDFDLAPHVAIVGRALLAGLIEL